MAKLNILIVGASIAGPATAYWLSKLGAKVTIIERFPSLRTGGQSVDIRGAGVSVMRKMGDMEPRVRAKSTQEEGVAFVRDDGSPYGVIRMSGDPERQSIVSEYEILRGDLCRILYDMTKDMNGVEYVFGETVKSMTRREAAGGLMVEFENGKLPTREYDLVVACDGASSRMRAMGMGCEARDHVVPSGSWAAYFSIKSDLIQGGKISMGCSAVGGRFVSVGPDPDGINRVMLMGVQPKTDDQVLMAFRKASSQGEQELKKFVAGHFRGAGWKTEQILAEMMDSEDFYASEIVQIKALASKTNIPSIQGTPLALVGDAGYAAGTAGGGTSLALTGAYILASEIMTHPGKLHSGLSKYEERMKPIAEELHKIPPLVPWIMAPQTAWGIWIRNQLFGLVAWSGVPELVQKYLGPWFEGGEVFQLPEYDWDRSGETEAARSLPTDPSPFKSG